MEGSLLIVGNGEGVLEKQNGKVIDSFDTVVRLGRYVTEGYEKYVGEKTDIISTIFWKLDLDRLKKSKVILSVPINLQESFKESELYISNEYKDYKDNIIYVNNESDIKGLEKMYTDILPPFEGIDKVNFSLGYKTIYFLRKLYPGKKIYTTGFDFFKTSWYWKKDHNRDDSNMHPYIWERLWYSKMKKIGEINEL
jgi:hypothetical protein